jgi:hypothetical protein
MLDGSLSSVDVLLLVSVKGSSTGDSNFQSARGMSSISIVAGEGADAYCDECGVCELSRRRTEEDGELGGAELMKLYRSPDEVMGVTTENGLAAIRVVLRSGSVGRLQVKIGT